MFPQQESVATTSSNEDDDLNYNLKGGRLIATVSPGDEIVISGLSGVYPNSMDVHEFRDNLFNKVDMVSPNIRWDYQHPEIPTRSGTIPEIDKYDTGYFGIHERQSQSLDATCRLLLEKTVEAIFDAGLHPADFAGTKTGVFIGICFSENEKVWFRENLQSKYYAMTGAGRSMTARRLSYFLKLKGPSYTTDTACSSSLYSLEHAYRAIRLGEIDAALVVGANLCLHPFLTKQFFRLGVLSKDGSCKSFDAQGDGYARSEAVATVILQKAKFAKRIYAELVHIRTNCDGYKEQSITFPSSSAQIDLLTSFYNECGVDKFSLSYLEAHGTGTFVGDPEECLAIDTVFTKHRKRPLLIGSVKSSIGHSEPASGLCSITKCIIAMETGFIPPNIHFTTPRPEIKGILEGRMKVVVENTLFQDDRGLIGINSFGFGGGNCHVLLKWNTKEKIGKGLPKDDLPRLVCVSGRTGEAVDTLLDAVSNNGLDAEFVGLLHEGFRKNVENHLYRGYAIVSKEGELSRSHKYSPGYCKSLYFAVGELNNWQDVGHQLMILPTFSAFIQRNKMICICVSVKLRKMIKQGVFMHRNIPIDANWIDKHFTKIQESLLSKKVNIYDVLLKNKDSKKIDVQLLGSFVVQAGIVNLLNVLSIKSTISYGYSYGKLITSYINGFITLEEALNYAFILSVALNGTDNNNNGNKLSIFQVTNEINSKNIKNNKAKLNDLEHLKEHLEKSALDDKALFRNYFDGAFKWVREHANSSNQNSFQNIETLDLDAVVLRIGNGPLDPSEDFSLVSLFNDNKKNYVAEFMQCLGRLYEFGYNPQIKKLYPSIEYPVSRSTPMISPHIKWLHNKTLFVPQFSAELNRQAKLGGRIYPIDPSSSEWSYITGHIIDGRNIFPGMGYLFVVWHTFALINDIAIDDMKIMFENCKFVRALTVPKEGTVALLVVVNPYTGNFEIVERDSVVVKGRVSLLNEKKDSRSYGSAVKIRKHPGFPVKSKDIYKEFRLRGYNYKGAFCGIENANVDSSKALIRWEDNWVAFMDCMLQLQLLQLDSKLLYVPTFIGNLTISAKTHLDMVRRSRLSAEETFVLPVVCDRATGVIRSGGITMSDLMAMTIPRRKNLSVPVLEKYKFVPNNTELDINDSIRVMIQIMLENAQIYQVNVVELIDEYTNEEAAPLTPIVKLVLDDLPLVQPLLKIFSKSPLDVDIEVEDRKLNSETNCLFVIVSNISKRQNILDKAFIALKENGFILCRENLECHNSLLKNPDITILAVHKTPTEALLLLQKNIKMKAPSYIKVSTSDDFSWIPELQNVLKSNSDVVLYAEKEITSGILGLINCLRTEPNGKQIRCVFLMDEVTEFQPTHAFFTEQLRKNMAVNVYKNNQWGTYRHLLMGENRVVGSEHCFVKATVPGDLSSLKWMEGPLHYHMTVPAEKKLIHVYYSALNFRDIMVASGKLNADVITKDRLHQEFVLGFEFSGRDIRGRRVMGLSSSGAISNLVLADSLSYFEVPDSWSLEEAATAPVAYITVVYALIMRGQLRKGETILIHSGSGAVGQAAIHLATYLGCTVFTTVGTQEKREFLKKTFPLLNDRHIGNSRDESFEQMVLRETNGRGVDVVLNSLAEEKLLASVRCLSRGGRQLEIGKYDLANNNELNLLLFQKEASIHGVMIDHLFTSISTRKKEIEEIITSLLKNGAIQPLSRTVFKSDEFEESFRFMTTGKHIGKVLIKIREPEQQLITLPSEQLFSGLPRFFCDPSKTYAIVGGLGGFGLELADWLVIRGARKLILSSRKGISTGYQDMRIRIWRSYGALVKISTAPIETKDGCRQLIQESLELGPIDAIFNLAVVLEDSLFENQTPEMFKTSFAPKAKATIHLDELTREMCPDLRYFVVFSSVSCGRGNAGQTNYAMANSVMERICELRRQSGYPALAIEWGAVADVGLVAEMVEDSEIVISGTLQQKIFNCLQVLDTLLKDDDDAIVSSMVVAAKRGANAADNIVGAVLNIIGVRDVKSVSLYSTLTELGMDSMAGVEVKQTLEREFEIYLTARDIRSMTLARLMEIEEEKYNSNNDEATEGGTGIDIFFKLIGDESESSVPCMQLKSNIESEQVAPKVLLFPGIEGFAKVFDNLAAKLNAHTIGLQFTYGDRELSIVAMAESLVHVVEGHLSKTEPFCILAYSYGSMVALEVVRMLESKGYSGTIIFLDGAPLAIQEVLLQFDGSSEDHFQTAFICKLLSTFLSPKQISEHKEAMIKCSSWEERVDLGIELVRDKLLENRNYFRTIAHNLYNRLIAMRDYIPSLTKLGSSVKLYKPKQTIAQSLDEDYGLSGIFIKPVDIKIFHGNHLTFLEDEALAEAINTDIRKLEWTC